MSGPWEEYQSNEKMPWEEYATTPSMTDSVLSGLAQGSTLGFSDELGGAKDSVLSLGEEGVDRVKSLFTGNDKDVHVSDLVSDYIASRDKRRAENEAAKAANPKAYLASELGGGLATAFIPGLGLAGQAGRAAALTREGSIALDIAKAAQAAKIGGAAAIGMTDADLLDKDPSKSLENLGTTAKNAATSAAVAPAFGIVAENTITPALGAVGRIATKPVRAFKDKFLAPFKVSENAENVIESAKNLGIDEEQIPGHLLTDDPEAKRAADLLSRSGRLGGSMSRNQMEPVTQKIKSGTEDILIDAAGETPTQVGKTVQSGVRDAFEAKRAPIRAKYDEIENTYSGHAIDRDAIEGLKLRLKGLAEDPGNFADAEKIIGDVIPRLDRVKTIGDLRRVRTRIDRVLSPGSSVDAQDAVSEIRNHLTQTRDDALNLAAHNLSEFNSAPVEIPTTKLHQADKEYAELATEIQNALGYKTKRPQGASAPVKMLEKENPELVRKVLNLFQNPKQLDDFTKTFPKEAELLRGAELARIKASASQGQSGFNPGAALKEVFGEPRGNPRYQPEVREKLLGDKFAKAKDLNTVQRALPPDYNPSHTASAKTWLGAFTNPIETTGSVLQHVQLKLRSPKASDITGNGTDGIMQRLANSPKGKRFVSVLQKASLRGPAAVASTHFLLSQTDPDYQAAVAGKDVE